MKLSKETIAILKNYSSISSNLVINAGSELKTKSAQNTIFANATISDIFPSEFGIYDLNEFLGVLTLFNSPELEFEDKFVKISDGDTSIKYFAADKSVLSYPVKDGILPSADVSFKLTADTLGLIMKTSSVLRVPDVSFVGSDGELKLIVSDRKNATSNAFEVKIGETNLDFCINLKVEMMKFIHTDYMVEISTKRISKFTAIGTDINYFIGIETNSTFG
jgi:hypothetical protein